MNSITELKNRVDELTKKLELYDKLHQKLIHENPDKFNTYFICGASTACESNSGLPDRIHVCAAYGSDVVKIYKRVD